MITLQNYIIFKDILSDKLIESFNKLDNSTYSDDLINENLMGELLVEARDTGVVQYILTFLTKLLEIKNAILNAESMYKKNKDLLNTYATFKETYNDICKKAFNKDSENFNIIEKYFSLKNNNSDLVNNIKDLFVIQKDGEEIKNYNILYNDKGKPIDDADVELKTTTFAKKKYFLIKDVNSLIKNIDKFETEHSKSAKEQIDKINDEVKNNESGSKWIAEIRGEMNKLKESWEAKLDEMVPEWNGELNPQYPQLTTYKMAYCSSILERILEAVQNKDKTTAYELLDEFKTTVKEQSDKIDKLIEDHKKQKEELKKQQTEIEKIPAENGKSEGDTPEEIQKSAENEVKVLKEGIVKTISQKVNVNVKDLGKTFINIVKSLRNNGEDKPAEAAENIAKNQNSDAMIGLNLMLLGGLATKGAQNRAKIIYIYCSIIAKKIQEKKYNKLFEQKPEENNTKEQ